MHARGPFRFSAFILGAVLCGASIAAAAMSPASSPTSGKALVLDGHVVHDVGDLWSHQSNWGLIGSMPTAGGSYSDAPSAMWPARSGVEYLWAAGLWVGARDGAGVPHVSTAGYFSEFRPTAAAGDTIHQTFQGAPGGNRYPFADPDDDGDGREDEDPLNGLDDDGDGLVDEDFAAVGDQHFASRYGDVHDSLHLLPDHVPLGLTIRQQSFQWAALANGRVIGFEFTITNTGSETLTDVFLGMFSDSDIGSRGRPGVADDDLAGSLSFPVSAYDGSLLPVELAYMKDAARTNQEPGRAAWVLCGVFDDAGAPFPVGRRGFQVFRGNAAFADGGDPTNDAERYELLSRDEVDPDTPFDEWADYRTLISTGPFATLPVGASLHFRTAFVIGENDADLLDSASAAVLTAYGRSFDRDGDPANGAEFPVPWIRPDEVLVAALGGRLEGRFADGGAELAVAIPAEFAAVIEVHRRAAGRLPARTWDAADLSLSGRENDSLTLTLDDRDAGPWPRSYELAAVIEGDRIPLDEVQVKGALPMRATLQAGPNPFNPRLQVRFSLPRDGHVLLQAYDLRGRRVADLVDADLGAGERVVAWEGRDPAGRALPSGTYLLRLSAAGELVETRVTLLR